MAGRGHIRENYMCVLMGKVFKKVFEAENYKFTKTLSDVVQNKVIEVMVPGSWMGSQ
jgi:hypothetical protein